MRSRLVEFGGLALEFLYGVLSLLIRVGGIERSSGGSGLKIGVRDKTVGTEIQYCAESRLRSD